MTTSQKIELAIELYLSTLDPKHPHYPLLSKLYPEFIRFMQTHRRPTGCMEDFVHNVSPAVELSSAMLASVLGSIQDHVTDEFLEAAIAQAVIGLQIQLRQRLHDRDKQIHPNDIPQPGTH